MRMLLTALVLGVVYGAYVSNGDMVGVCLFGIFSTVAVQKMNL